MRNRSNGGFTIVELLIVIVVIGILAAITIVAYNGIQNRANNVSVQSDVRSNAARLSLFKTDNERPPTLAEMTSNQAVVPKFSNGSLKVASYCVADSQYAIGAQSKNDQKYYSLNGGAVTNNNTITIANICASLGVTKAGGVVADTTILVNNGGAFLIGAQCAAENATCTFTGTRTIAYGANGAYLYQSATNTLSCSNVTFGGDPAVGTVKACYLTD